MQPPLHPLYDHVTPSGLVERACARIAERAHRLEDGSQEMRNKGEGIRLPYITHPLLAAKVLRAVGITDRFTLGAAILHDTLEQGCWKNQRRALQQALAAELVEEFMAAGSVTERSEAENQANRIAQVICTIVQEVTNPDHMPESKLIYQLEHVERLSSHGQLVKMADHAASIIDDMLTPTDWPREKTLRFNNKALQVARLCHEANPWLYRLVAQLCRDSRTLLEASDMTEARVLRGEFSLENEVMRAIGQPGTPPLPEVCTWVMRPGACQVQSGLFGIGLNGDGNVSAFQMLVDTVEDGKHPVNRIMSRQLDLLLNDTDPYVGPLQLSPEPQCCLYRQVSLEKPLPLQSFLTISREAGSLDKRLALMAERSAADIDRGKA